MKVEELEDMIFKYPVKNTMGFTREEISDICNKLSVKEELFNEKHGYNTVALNEEGKVINHHCDVFNTFFSILYNKTLFWD